MHLLYFEDRHLLLFFKYSLSASKRFLLFNSLNILSNPSASNSSLLLSSIFSLNVFKDFSSSFKSFSNLSSFNKYSSSYSLSLLSLSPLSLSLSLSFPLSSLSSLSSLTSLLSLSSLFPPMGLAILSLLSFDIFITPPSL